MSGRLKWLIGAQLLILVGAVAWSWKSAFPQIAEVFFYSTLIAQASITGFIACVAARRTIWRIVVFITIVATLALSEGINLWIDYSGGFHYEIYMAICVLWIVMPALGGLLAIAGLSTIGLELTTHTTAEDDHRASQFPLIHIVAATVIIALFLGLQPMVGTVFMQLAEPFSSFGVEVLLGVNGLLLTILACRLLSGETQRLIWLALLVGITYFSYREFDLLTSHLGYTPEGYMGVWMCTSACAVLNAVALRMCGVRWRWVFASTAEATVAVD